MVDRGSLTNRNHDLSRFVGEEIRSFLPVPEARLLPADFEPNPWTVICGRGKTSFNHGRNHLHTHPTVVRKIGDKWFSHAHAYFTVFGFVLFTVTVGNRRFRILCDLNLEAYEATTKTEKSFLVMHIVDAVRDGQGAFVKQVRHFHSNISLSLVLITLECCLCSSCAGSIYQGMVSSLGCRGTRKGGFATSRALGQAKWHGGFR